jgi:hypothetical protein
VRYLGLKNGDLKKNTLSKIESHCQVDSKHIFESKIGRVLFEKKVFKVDTAFMRRRSCGGAGGAGCGQKIPAVNGSLNKDYKEPLNKHKLYS